MAGTKKCMRVLARGLCLQTTGEEPGAATLHSLCWLRICRKTLALGTGIRQSNIKFITGVVLDAALGKNFFGKKVFGSLVGTRIGQSNSNIL